MFDDFIRGLSFEERTEIFLKMQEIFCGGREALQIEINVISDGCGGCQYHEYPYKAQLPILIDGKRPVRVYLR